MKTINVIELFAGVGGFRLGLDQASNDKVTYKTVWSSQWEPSTKTQHASDIYKQRFGEDGHSNEDISQVVENYFDSIPEHQLLVGGFPCQDYSVARTANQAHGLVGKKGVLWWSIFNILKKNGSQKSADFLLLENVDRLLKSPTLQRGRDFAVMLSSLSSLGYVVEWRVINAADYGFPQRRRRVFILAYKTGTSANTMAKNSTPQDWIKSKGIMANSFPVETDNDIDINTFKLDVDPADVSENFSSNAPKVSPFLNAGLMINNQVFTAKTTPQYSGKKTLLKEILIDENEVPENFFIDPKSLNRWEYLKNGKKEKRCTKDGFEYMYSEGGMIFPDNLDNASRTIVTGEGGASPSRFKHVIKTKSGRLRRLMPIELERLNMFPDNHTAGVTDTKRAFIMGNALVIGVVKKIAQSLSAFV